MKRRYLFRLLDVVWLAVLAIYVLAGISITPFHGDEAMQITMSSDYFIAFVQRQPQALPVTPPYVPDSDAWLRLINGSVNRYGIGLSLHAAGYSSIDLPTLWQWPLSVEDNMARGSRPSADVLNVSRISSALFLALSISVLFAIGGQMGGRLPAYFASGLYALNPVVLLNGRRAMMEGSLLFFGLLTIWVAVMVCQERNRWSWWLLLGVVGGLALASKHSGIVFVVSAWGWITAVQLIKATILHGMRYLLSRLAVTAVITIAVFIALSPALWNNPVARLGDLVVERQKLLDSQVVADPNGATTMQQRIEGIITQPFMQPPTYFEAAFWGGSESVRGEIARYTDSLLGGIQWSTVLGTILTLLSGIGMLFLIRSWRKWQGGMLVWLVITIASLLVNPLPWQRYYLPLYPLAALAVGIGVVYLHGLIYGLRSST
ncbi:MAG: glycosyltransferase family 39 protein [Anaerolineae bacterium]